MKEFEIEINFKLVKTVIVHADTKEAAIEEAKRHAWQTSFDDYERCDTDPDCPATVISDKDVPYVDVNAYIKYKDSPETVRYVKLRIDPNCDRFEEIGYPVDDDEVFFYFKSREDMEKCTDERTSPEDFYIDCIDD